MTGTQRIQLARNKFVGKMGVLKGWGFTNAKLTKVTGTSEKTTAQAIANPFDGASGSTVLLLLEFYEEEKQRRGVTTL